MADESQQGTVLLQDRWPISAVKFRIVEILALNAPGLAENLRPLSPGIDAHLHLRQVKRTIAHSNGSWAICSHDAPTGSATGGGLIKKLLLVMRERVRANAFEKRRRRALFELVPLQTKCRRAWSGGQNWFGVIEASGRTRGEIAVVTGRYVYGNDSLSDSIEVNANIHGSRCGRRRRRLWRRFGASLARRGAWWWFITSFGQRSEERRVGEGCSPWGWRSHEEQKGA